MTFWALGYIYWCGPVLGIFILSHNEESVDFGFVSCNDNTRRNLSLSGVLGFISMLPIAMSNMSMKTQNLVSNLEVGLLEFMIALPLMLGRISSSIDFSGTHG